MIHLSGLTKSYHNHFALHDVNLSIEKGEIFGVIGKSGAGKSTLLRCINLLERPDKGTVMINRDNLTQFSDAQLRQARHKIGMIFQHFNLLSTKTVYDNIALPMRIQGISAKHIYEKIHELLPLVGLSHKIKAYPAQLSGGQKQRVAIARALSTSPTILLCDEATSALDPETTDSILALLKTINHTYKITMVMITHEMDVVKRICHRLAVMDKGKIIETMKISDVFKRKNSQARNLMYNQLCPPLPHSLTHHLIQVQTTRPVIRIFFEGTSATLPFISQTSRELQIDVNILLANIDRFDDLSCGVLVVEIHANHELRDAFLNRCQQANLTVEVLGYIIDHVA